MNPLIPYVSNISNRETSNSRAGVGDREGRGSWSKRMALSLGPGRFYRRSRYPSTASKDLLGVKLRWRHNEAVRRARWTWLKTTSLYPKISSHWPEFLLPLREAKKWHIATEWATEATNNFLNILQCSKKKKNVFLKNSLLIECWNI